MGRLIVFILVVGAVFYAWREGWITRWIDAGIESVRGTQRDARTVRPADPAEGKK